MYPKPQRRPSHGEATDDTAHFCVWHKQPHHVEVAARRKRDATRFKSKNKNTPPFITRSALGKEGGHGCGDVLATSSLSSLSDDLLPPPTSRQHGWRASGCKRGSSECQDGKGGGSWARRIKTSKGGRGERGAGSRGGSFWDDNEDDGSLSLEDLTNLNP
jgi:hypothetical protein